MRQVIVALVLALTRIAASMEVDKTPIASCQSNDSVSLFELPARHEYDGTYLVNPEARGHEPRGKWKGPEYCLSGFCTYGTPLRDIALVTRNSKADNIIAQLSQLSELPPSSLTNEQQEDDMFYESDIPGKGIGLIAGRPIRRGEIVMKKRPSLLVQVEIQARTDVHVRDILYGHAMDRMRDRDRGRVMGMIGSDLGDKIDKNCFRLRISTDENADGGDHHIGCYPDVARLNHDCRPSLVYDINNSVHVISAVRDIAAGEELSISYIRLLSPRAQRLAQLKHWGFECSCGHCNMSDKDAATSDAHLRAIVGLEGDLGNFKDMLVMPETGAKLVELYQRERLDLYLSRAYEQAAINYAAFGMDNEAKKYARLTLEHLEIEPASSAADAASMRLLSENPRLHGAWGVRLKGIN
ncbi:SET domain-containing protein 5 [Metarhizium acridum]|uniref:SET domain-containing protein 5 n=1 Tax=Metarhizium acridum TaxID=92637 RepID=UPI001C6CEB74|nr:SET domain-containing protein 5 [Metarhizium acridum]